MSNRILVKVDIEKDANQFNLVGCVVSWSYVSIVFVKRVLGLMICFDELTYSYEQ